MWSHLIAAIVAAAVAWTVQGWRYGEQLAKHDQQRAEEARQLAEDRVEQTRFVMRADRSRYAQVQSAQHAARAREVALRRDRDATRNELERVRDASAAAVRDARESAAACPGRAAALQVVFDQCAGALAGLAEVADRHASDVRTLIEAWPSDVPRVADSPPSNEE